MGMMLPEGMPPPGPMGAPPGMGGPPPMPEPPPEPKLDPQARLRAVMAEIRSIAEEGGFTEADKLIVEDVNSKIQKLNAGFEKQDQALYGGGTPASQGLARAFGTSG